MASPPVPEPVDLARTRRAELLAAITALESALAAPAGAPVWVARVQARLDQLAGAFDDHVQATEGPDGMYADILRSAPRLRFGVDRLATEHDEIGVAIDALNKLIDGLTDAGPDDVGRIRNDGVRLLARLVRHRQRGADLVFEAYAQDIGGCD
ncbi:MAG TPA: hemerythrin domain-containing protein [Jiangellaceae bacterium]